VAEPSEGAREPVVVLGGFLSAPRLYRALARTLTEVAGAPARVVPVGLPQWVGAVSQRGWSVILRALERTVRGVASSSPTGRVVLVGHSAGGVVGRLYLSPEPFRGEVFAGLDVVSRLVTLGSPHHGGAFSPMRRFVDRRYPGAFFAPRVGYATVAGAALRGDPRGSLPERFAARAYARLGCARDESGDGLVPVPCALLDGAEHVVLPGVNHAPPWPRPWYGTPAVAREWWARAGGRANRPPAASC
jgi:pimeloyl-ACP methyl ester carboxylesterase